MIRHGLLLPLAPLALLAGCATPNAPSAGPAPASQKPVTLHEAGLERVIGRTGAQLTALFGDADLDSHEGAARRMQFVGPACVLDAYLFPAKTGAEPVVTYVDARLPSGEDMDRASCIAALSRRAAAP
ncbi:MAG TPA: hypothetical protein VKQ09_03675 [Sphingomonas sp.]|nr:hypothetical protein [Sphingomonas sp.]